MTKRRDLAALAYRLEKRAAKPYRLEKRAAKP
jgi:hypothetical protein